MTPDAERLAAAMTKLNRELNYQLQPTEEVAVARALQAHGRAERRRVLEEAAEIAGESNYDDIRALLDSEEKP